MGAKFCGASRKPATTRSIRLACQVRVEAVGATSLGTGYAPPVGRERFILEPVDGEALRSRLQTSMALNIPPNQTQPMRSPHCVPRTSPCREPLGSVTHRPLDRERCPPHTASRALNSATLTSSGDSTGHCVARPGDRPPKQGARRDSPAPARNFKVKGSIWMGRRQAARHRHVGQFHSHKDLVSARYSITR